jgi:hypothetical protein
LLSFEWWEPVYYKLDDPGFPSELREKRGRFVGISEHVGHAMTYMILTDDTQKIVHRSNVRTALDPTSQNKRVDPPSGEDYQPPSPSLNRVPKKVMKLWMRMGSFRPGSINSRLLTPLT